MNRLAYIADAVRQACPSFAGAVAIDLDADVPF